MIDAFAPALAGACVLYWLTTLIAKRIDLRLSFIKKGTPIMKRVILIFLSLQFFPALASASCVSPPAEAGVIIFNAAHKVMQYCNGDDWIGLWGGGGGSGEGGASLWSQNGNDIHYVDGKVGVGTSSPSSLLHVAGTTRLGNVKVGADWHGASWPGLSNEALTGEGNYALMQSAAGQTLINGAAGQSVSLRVNNVSILTATETAITATKPLAMGSNKITGLAAPTANADAATKAYVDSKDSALANCTINVSSTSGCGSAPACAANYVSMWTETESKCGGSDSGTTTRIRRCIRVRC